MSIGAQGRLLFDTATPFDNNSIWFEFNSESIQITQEFVNSAGIRGTRSHDAGRTRSGAIRVSGDVSLDMSRILLDNILYPALGTPEAANVFAPAETIPGFYLLIDKGADIFLVSEAKIGTLTITGQQSQIVTVTASIEAENMTGDQSWPDPSPEPENSKPYFFADAQTVTLNGTAREIFGFSVSIDNVLDTENFGTNLTREDLIDATDRIVTVTFDLEGSPANKDLTMGNVSGEAVDLVMTNAEETGSSVTLSLGRLAYERAVPTTDGKGRRIYQITGQSRAHLHPTNASHVPDIQITNDHA
jgi:hypothetical protein